MKDDEDLGGRTPNLKISNRLEHDIDNELLIPVKTEAVQRRAGAELQAN